MISSILPTYNRAPLTFVRGEGSWLITQDENRYLDLGAGIAVNSLGHAHPELVKTLEKQARNLWHVSNLYNIPQQQHLADLLVNNSFADTVFFTNSGTESCELAIKMARKYWFDKEQPNRVNIITFEGSFHGRSSAGIAAAGSEKLTKGFGPLLEGFIHLPWNDQDKLKQAIDTNTAAILIEPIQGEGGIRALPNECLVGLRRLCDEHGILLILDEVQCGVGRSGKLFAHEWADITPDIMMVAKGIGGGFPLGAVLATENAASAMTLGTHGSTYGGNPLACSVGATVLDIIAQPQFLDHVNDVANRLSQGLFSLVDRYPDVFCQVRGKGLMRGLKCTKSNMDVIEKAYENQLLIVPASENVVRLLPPLNITSDDVGQALSRLENIAQSLSN